VIGTDVSSGATFLAGSSSSFDAVTVPTTFIGGVNNDEDPDSPLNLSIPAMIGLGGKMTESEYVSLAMKMPDQAVGVFQCQYKWFFDFDPDPFNPSNESSSSSSSESSSSSSSSP
jgi:hypothetical protein